MDSHFLRPFHKHGILIVRFRRRSHTEKPLYTKVDFDLTVLFLTHGFSTSPFFLLHLCHLLVKVVNYIRFNTMSFSMVFLESVSIVAYIKRNCCIQIEPNWHRNKIQYRWHPGSDYWSTKCHVTMSSPVSPFSVQSSTWRRGFTVYREDGYKVVSFVQNSGEVSSCPVVEECGSPWCTCPWPWKPLFIILDGTIIWHKIGTV